MDTRPKLDQHISIQDFQDFYWLKEELIAFCKQENLSRTGSKIEIANRIISYLQTGEAPKETIPSKKKTATFDWNTELLTLQTVITDNYKNTENVRQFFREQIGKSFKFNVLFMNWMKNNVGKSLQEAIQAWHRIQQAKKSSPHPKEIAPQFEYNRYLRDFLADNPNKSRTIGIQLWNIKKTKRGKTIYKRSDLKLLG